MNIAIYASAHGYGHASRSHEVARTLVRKHPDITVHFSSWVPDSFFEVETHPRILRRRRRLDVGLRQIDSLTMDLPGTLKDLGDLAGDAEHLISEEVDFLRSSGAEIVLADLPHLAFEAAAEAGITAWGLSNFSWDWIYEAYLQDFPELSPHISRISDAYRLAEGLFRLPFSGGMKDFRNVMDVPLVARRSKLGKAEVREKLGLSREQSIVLFSFGGIELKIPRQPNIPNEITLLCSEPSPDPGPPFVHLTNKKLAGLGLRYCDLVVAADAVVSKLGYGIVSECIANRTALLYTPRGRFREYPILVRGVQEYIPSAQIMPENIESGGWLPVFRTLMGKPFPQEPDCRGADVVADRLLSEIAP